MNYWRTDAACIDVDPVFFFDLPPGRGGAMTAKAICRQCPVRRQCLDTALQFEHRSIRHGVWGGLTPKERGRLARQSPGRPTEHLDDRRVPA